MVKEYKKGKNVRLSTHFYSDTFRCKGGSSTKILIDDALIEKLEKF